MTRDDIIRLYEKANGWSPEGWDKTVNELERFANLVAAAEREACAKLFEFEDELSLWEASKIIAEIRARGQNEETQRA